jgi:hypothetical protein
MKALRMVGVPYTDAEIAKAAEAVKGKTELDALIAYLQVLGTAVKYSKEDATWTSTTCAARHGGLASWPSSASWPGPGLAVDAAAFDARRAAIRRRGASAAGSRTTRHRNRNERLLQRRLVDFTSGRHDLGHPDRLPACCWPSPAEQAPVMANDNTTGHVWDEDLRELNNPLPRWWMWLFVITVVFSGVYLASTRAWAPTRARWVDQSASTRPSSGKARAAMAPVYASTRDVAGRAGQDPTAGDGHRRAPVHQQLRAVPRLRRARQQGLPEPDRRPTGCTAARPRRSRPSRARAAGRDAADGRGGGHAPRTCATWRTTC